MTNKPEESDQTAKLVSGLMTTRYIAVVFDPKIVSPADYNKLICALDELVKAHGHGGIELLATQIIEGQKPSKAE